MYEWTSGRSFPTKKPQDSAFCSDKAARFGRDLTAAAARNSSSAKRHSSQAAARTSTQDTLGFFQRQAEILNLRYVHVARDNENLSLRHNAFDPDKFRQHLHLKKSRHRSCPLTRKIRGYATPVTPSFFPIP